MDATIVNLAIYLAATFAAAFVTGLAGLAFGLVAAAVWLHILTPTQTATLIIAFGLVVQGVSVWKLRHALRWSRLWPFLFGAAFGVPLGQTTIMGLRSFLSVTFVACNWPKGHSALHPTSSCVHRSRHYACCARAASVVDLE
jgi:uncharacterized membrane protein YfcA